MVGMGGGGGREWLMDGPSPLPGQNHYLPSYYVRGRYLNLFIEHSLVVSTVLPTFEQKDILENQINNTHKLRIIQNLHKMRQFDHLCHNSYKQKRVSEMLPL